MSDIYDYLSQIANHFPHQKTYESYVLRCGKEYAVPAVARPKGIRKGTDKMCFMNSYRIADEHGWTYVEGFAFSIIPTHHAWCVTPEGVVVETTWKDAGSAYYGVEFDRRFMDSVMLETRHYGIMDYTSRVFREHAEKVLGGK